MKIALAIENIGKTSGGNNVRGGAQRVLVDLANELSKRGHEVTVFCTDVNSRDEFMYPISPRVQYHNLLGIKPSSFMDRAKHKFARKFIALQRKTSRRLDSKKPSRLNRYAVRQNWRLGHILYKHVLSWPRVIRQNSDVFVLFGPLDYFLHIPPMLSANRNFPIVYSFHNQVRFYFELASTHPHKLARFNKILELSDLILVLLPSFVDELPGQLQSKTLSIPNPIRSIDKHSRANPGLDAGLKTILAAGRLTPRKNHKVLLEAFAKSAHKHPDWQVKIFGDGVLGKELAGLIHELELTDRAFLMGTTDAIREEYQKAQILAMPSKVEGFPLALGDGMAHGLPAVGFDNASGVNYLIRHGHNGLLADGDNPVESLSSCLEQLMTNPGLRMKLGQNGTESIKPFDPKKIYDLWEKTILEARCLPHNPA